MNADADRDWWTPHALIVLFGALVAAILRVVPGWSAPLHAWITLAAVVNALLAAHAGVHASRFAWRRCPRDAVLALLLAVALGVAAAALIRYGRTHLVTMQDAPVDAMPARQAP